MIQSPTVGRKLWYRPNGDFTSHTMSQINAGEPLDATVVCVHDDHCVNLVVFDALGYHFQRSNVTLVQEGQTAPNEGIAYCEWMPYQTAQHNKNREVQIAAIVKD